MYERVHKHEAYNNSNKIEPELRDEDYPIQEPEEAE